LVNLEWLAQAYAVPARNSLFWLWLVVLGFSQGLFNRRLALFWRCALLGLAFTVEGAGIVLFRDWYSGWVPGLAAILVILWVGAPRIGLALTVAGSAAIAPWAHEISRTLQADKDYDLLTRHAAWDILVDLIKLDPLLGIGFANYYHYTPLFPILGWSVKFNSHNQYFDLVAQMGLVGLLCFVWLSWAIGRLAWNLRSRVPAGFEQAYVYGALGGLIGMLVAGYLGDWLLPFVYNIGLTGFRASVLGWVFLGGLLLLERVAAREQSAREGQV
jgi:O-antigen ligase